MQNKLTSFSDLMKMSVDQFKDSKRMSFYFIANLINGLVNFAFLIPPGIIVVVAAVVLVGMPGTNNSFGNQIMGATSYLSAQDVNVSNGEFLNLDTETDSLNNPMVPNPQGVGKTAAGKFLTPFILALIISLPYFLFIIGYNNAYNTYTLLHINYNEIPGFGFLIKKSFSKALRVAVITLVIVLIAMLGFILLIIPGVVVLMLLMYAPWIAVHENKGVTESLKTSWNMVKQYFFDILGRNMLAGFMYYAVILLANGLASILVQNDIPLIGSLITMVVNFMGTYLLVLFTTNVYMDVRNALGMERPSLDSDKPNDNISSAGIGAISSGYGVGINTSTATMGSSRSTLAATSTIDTTSSSETWSDELPPSNLNTIN